MTCLCVLREPLARVPVGARCWRFRWSPLLRTVIICAGKTLTSKRILFTILHRRFAHVHPLIIIALAAQNNIDRAAGHKKFHVRLAPERWHTLPHHSEGHRQGATKSGSCGSTQTPLLGVRSVPEVPTAGGLSERPLGSELGGVGRIGFFS